MPLKMDLYKPRLLKITCTQSYVCVGTTMNKQTLHYCFNYIHCAPPQNVCCDQHGNQQGKSYIYHTTQEQTYLKMCYLAHLHRCFTFSHACV